MADMASRNMRFSITRKSLVARVAWVSERAVIGKVAAEKSGRGNSSADGTTLRGEGEMVNLRGVKRMSLMCRGRTELQGGVLVARVRGWRTWRDLGRIGGPGGERPGRWCLTRRCSRQRRCRSDRERFC